MAKGFHILRGWNIDDIRIIGDHAAPVITGLTAADSFTVSQVAAQDSISLPFEVSDANTMLTYLKSK